MRTRPWYSLNSLILMSVLVACPVSAAAPTKSTAVPSKSAPISQKQALHRADFRVEGASCVTCLRRIAATFRKDAGVKKVDISVFRPYWGIVIYDAGQTSFAKLTDAIKKEHVRLVDVDDKVIDSIPAVIVPKGLGLMQKEKDKPPLKPVLVH
jgi:hypothetical protein